jgi:hypothetical protein
MNIIGIEGMSLEQLNAEYAKGARFVIYEYCISICLLTFRRSSDIYFIPAGQGSFSRGLGFTVLSLLLGWWGIPWGPIFTIAALATNLGGGRDVTREVMNSLYYGSE